MIELLALAACATIQVEAGGHGPSSVFEVRFPEGSSTPLGTLDRRLNAIGYSHAQALVYGVDDDGRLVALNRAGRLVGTPTEPVHLLRHAVAGAVVGERLVVRVGPWLYSVDINPASPGYGRISHEATLRSAEGLSVDDFDHNAADGLLYGVSTHGRGSVVVAINPTTGRVTRVPGVGRLPGGSSYGAVTLSRDGSLYVTNNRLDGRSVLYRVALDGSGTVTEITSRRSLNTIDSSGCLAAPPVVDPPDPTPTPTPTTPPTTTTPPPTPTPPPTTTPPLTTTPSPPTTTPAPLPVVPPPPRRTTTPTTPPTTSPPTRPAPAPEPPGPVPGALPAGPPEDMKLPERKNTEEPALRNNVRDQRRWGLTAILLILGAAAMGRQAARRR
ncbi:DUF6923 family protein [Saccharothrix xinjiangensis]|uniref:DUF6923 family protein n=1 Tax=Saccharothrix xinjiangensis TaxID=204798 RepID=A0ABV9YCF4_9PSEU